MFLIDNSFQYFQFLSFDIAYIVVLAEVTAFLQLQSPGFD